MTVTVIDTDVTLGQIMDGDDVIFLRDTGSIITGFTVEGIEANGISNEIFVDGLIASQSEAIELKPTSSVSSISIGASAHLVGLNSSYYTLRLDGADNTASNHGTITGSYALGLDGTGNVVYNFGVVEGLGNPASNIAGVTFRGADGTLVNAGTIVGTNFGVGTRNFFQSGSEIINTGTISGDTGIVFTDGYGAYINNGGTITGSGGIAIEASVDLMNILNTGIINGDVVFGGADAYLKNSGEIHGDVLLAASGSYYKGAVDGWVSGGVRGAGGNDTIYGASGFDYIEGGGGDDYVKGRAGDDRIFAHEGTDTLRGNAGDDEIQGGRQDDMLYGGRGDDTLSGGKGDDTIKGGNGEDEMWGGGGADVFIFGRKSGDDSINDFDNNTDKLDLTAFAVASVGDLNAAGAIAADGSGGSFIDLTLIGGDGVIAVDDMGAGQWSNADFIF